DVLAIATQLEEQLADVGAGSDEHEQNGFGREHRDDRESVAVLEDGGEQLAALRRRTEVVGRADDGRNAGGDVVSFQPGTQLTVDEQPIAPEHDGRIDAVSLPDGSDQITNARHSAPQLPAKCWRS